MKKILNLEYGVVHATYWMSYGVISTFASALLLARGYSNGEIGMIFAAANVVAVILQPIMADLADRSRRLSLFGVCQIMSATMLVLTVGVFALRRQSLALTVIYVMLIAWAVAVQPLINALTFKLMESGVHISFSNTRSMGSFVYAIICATMGSAVERWGEEILPLSDGLFLIFLMISLAVVASQFRKACRLRDEGLLKENDLRPGKASRSEHPEQDGSLKTEDDEEINLMEFTRRNKMFFVMTIGVLGVFFANGTLNNFMLQIITPLGGDSEDMGQIFFLLAILEIPTLLLFDKINRHFSCQTLLKVASVFYVVKIVITWQADSVGVIMASQITQITSFALFLPAMVQFINEIMSRGEAVKGQALYTTMGTVASVISSLIGGMVLDASGAKMLLMIATVFTMAGTVIIFMTIDRIKKRRELQ